MFEPSRVVALLLARFGPGDGNCATRDERKLAEAFGRILLEAAHCELTIADEEELEVDDEEKMDEEWDIMSEIDEVCSPLPYESGFVGFGGKPIPVEQVFSSPFSDDAIWKPHIWGVPLFKVKSAIAYYRSTSKGSRPITKLRS
ncbi:hypothetical protein Aduo_001118 [Ancylostoma duodenale]